MKKIVLAIDSFKGCLTSEEVEQCVAEEIHRLHPQCQTVAIPIADGGEGMLDTLINAMQGQIIYTRAHDPLMRMRTTRYGILTHSCECVQHATAYWAINKPLLSKWRK